MPEPPVLRSHDINLAQLRQIAENEKTELSVGLNAENKTELGRNQGTWGQRVIRALSVFFTPAKKASEYLSAKVSVLNSLKKAYNDEIGEKVFRANIGHSRGDSHTTSKYHPITGGHIARMLEQADQLKLADQKALVEHYGKPENGGTSFGASWRGRDGQSLSGMPERATTDWVRRKGADQGGPTPQDPPSKTAPDRRNVNLRGERIDVNLRDDPGGRLAASLQGNAQRKLEDQDFVNEKQVFYTLDIALDQGGDDMGTHTIGVRFERDKNTVNVFDSNHGEFNIPKDQLAEWMRAHLAVNHPNAVTNGIEVHRATETMGPMFDKSSGEWRCDTTIEVPNSATINEMQKGLIGIEGGGLKAFGNLEVIHQFNEDIGRDAGSVIIGGRAVNMTPDNAEKTMTDLVSGGSEAENKKAATNLSFLMNQTIGNGAVILASHTLKDRMDSSVMLGTTNQNMLTTRIDDDPENPIIRVEYTMVAPITHVGTPGEELDQRRHAMEGGSVVTTTMTLDIPLSSLRKDRGYLEVRVNKPLEIKLDLKPRVGALRDNPLDGRRALGFMPQIGNSEKLVSANTTYPHEVSEVLKESRNLAKPMLQNGMALDTGFAKNLADGNAKFRSSNGEVTTFVFDENTPLDFEAYDLFDDGPDNLSYLSSPEVERRLYQQSVRRASTMLSYEAPQTLPDPHSTTFSRVDMPNGEPGIEIEYRCRVPKEEIDKANSRLVFPERDFDLDGGAIDTVTVVRVPLVELNRPEGPTTFFIPESSRLEWVPTPPQVEVQGELPLPKDE